MEDHLTTVKLIISGLAEYLQVTLSAKQIKMYAEDLSDLDLGQLKQAIKILRTTKRQFYGKFPLPAEIRECLEGTVEDNATAAVDLIFKALGKFDYHSSKDAKEFMGELAWSVVSSNGTWPLLCQNVTTDKVGIYRAQLTKIAQAHQNRARAGLTDVKPMLPGFEQKKLVKLTKAIGN